MQQSPPTAPSPPCPPPRQGPVSPPPGLPGALPHFLHSLQAARGVLGGGGGWGPGMREQSPAVQNGAPTPEHLEAIFSHGDSAASPAGAAGASPSEAGHFVSSCVRAPGQVVLQSRGRRQVWSESAQGASAPSGSTRRLGGAGGRARSWGPCSCGRASRAAEQQGAAQRGARPPGGRPRTCGHPLTPPRQMGPGRS